MDSNYRAFWKRQNTETMRLGGVGGGDEEGEQVAHRGSGGGAAKLLRVLL